jgi:hypothetical protein
MISFPKNVKFIPLHFLNSLDERDVNIVSFSVVQEQNNLFACSIYILKKDTAKKVRGLSGITMYRLGGTALLPPKLVKN